MSELIFDRIYDIRVGQIVWRHNKSIVIHALCRGRPVEEIAEYVNWSVGAIQEIANNLTAVIYELVASNIISIAQGAELLWVTEEELEGRLKDEGYLE